MKYDGPQNVSFLFQSLPQAKSVIFQYFQFFMKTPFLHRFFWKFKNPSCAQKVKFHLYQKFRLNFVGFTKPADLVVEHGGVAGVAVKPPAGEPAGGVGVVQGAQLGQQARLVGLSRRAQHALPPLA